MAQPPVYAPAHAFVSDDANIPSFPGQNLDIEFNALEAALAGYHTNLALIQRDDGALANGIVTLDALDTVLAAGLGDLPSLAEVEALIATAAAASVAALSATSTTSVAIGTGAKSFTTQTSKLFVAGQFLQIASHASAVNYMHGTVTSFVPATGALVMNVLDTGGSGTFADWDISISAPQGSTGATGAAGSSPAPPQGRLTLTSGTAVMTSGVAAATTLYYTPAVGQLVPIYNGSAFVMSDTGGQLSQATTDATKSPAAVANNSNYDIFVWNDSGTFRATRGPAWSSGTSRGTGAGTTELQILSGFPTNKVAITNGPAANRGTYVGTVRSNGTATLDMVFGSAATGGGAALLNVWNAYNQVLTTATVTDTTATWSYTSAATRAANTSTTNRVSFVSGLAVMPIAAKYEVFVNISATAGAYAQGAFALDSTSTQDRQSFVSNPTAAAFVSKLMAAGNLPPQIGYHYIQAAEAADGTNAVTFYGATPNQFLEVATWQ